MPGAPVKLLHHLFEQQVAKSPHADAVVCGQRHLAYAELETRSNELARLLAANGIKRCSRVALLLPRGPNVYIALLAVLKAGAAYVPIDPDYPSERVSFILADSGAEALFTADELAAKATGFSGKTFKLEDLEPKAPDQSFPPSHPNPGTLPEDLSYIIYTSGTTGWPKGVQIEHRSAAHLVLTECRLFKVGPGDRVFQGFSIAFDASVEEIWLAFASGATLVVGTAEDLRSGPALSRILSDSGVTVLSCVPTLLAMMEDDVPSLRLLILGGETCPSQLVKRWWRPGLRIVNTYGPTEATVVATYAECHPDWPVTIGQPLPGYIALVLNDQLQLAGHGEAGELALGGIGLARGYLGEPELTAEKFVFLKLEGGASQKLYRTGDRVRRNAKGDLEFLGRIDSQVKIRGFRVELSEIESVLLECREVKAAAVALRDGGSAPAPLVGYIVPLPGAQVDPSKLRTILKTRLPNHMVPGLIEIVTALPMLPSGKVDRQALPDPCPGAIESQREIELPRTVLERELVTLWSTLFAIPAVSVHDDFFLDLGGHSLLAARMVSQLRHMPEFAGLSMADVYRHPTAAGLARKLELDRDRIPEPSSTESGGERSAARKIDGRPNLGGGPPQVFRKDPRATEEVTDTQPIPFWRHFVCGLAQLLSLVFVLSFFALQWLAPYLTYTVLVEEEYDFVTSMLTALASLVLLYPAMLLAAILLKWLIIGRYKSGIYPLWGFYYFRFWLVTAIEATVPVSYLSGTPLLPIYLRLMGAKVGRNVSLHADNFAIYDLLSIGDESSINSDASLLGYSVSGGWLRIGSIRLGKRCFVGTRAVIGENASMADDAALEDLSLLQAGEMIDPEQTWIGSPAQPAAKKNEARSADGNASPGAKASESAPFWFVLHAAGMLIFPVLVVAALFPGIALMNRLNYLDPYYWYLLLSPLIAVSFVILLCLEIAALKWILLGRIRPGRYPLNSWYYLRKWFVDKTMELSLDVIGPLYASVYLSPWYKLLGAKLGQGAEISTASFISPDLLAIGAESFIADNASLGAPRVRDGFVSIGPNQIGRRAFIGNSALLPPGSVIGDDVLIGCLSAPPENPADALRPDSAWLGSPALFLPQRLKSAGFGEETTFAPPIKLRILRAAIEFVRVITPSTGFIILTSLLFSALLLLHDYFSLAQTLLFFPVLYLGCGLAAAAFTIVTKWVLVGRYRPGEKPLWSTFVWRNELINALHEHLASPFLAGALSGTPFLSWYLRLLGARIGRRVYVETTDFSEFDLVRIGDEATLNADCIIQTHLFEDRVMKMSRLEIGSRCSVGASSLVLYDTRMDTGAKLGPLSLLMKGEFLPAHTSWAGIPARLGR